MIVAHESIHVKEKHTLDILFTEILFLLQWFNPFAWLIKDAVKNNLEYKTDHEIVKTNDPQTYQLAMVALADKKGVAPFLTALNGSQLKSRIIMMKKKTENKFAPLKQLVILPLLAVLVTGLSNKEVKTEIVENQALIVNNFVPELQSINSDTIKPPRVVKILEIDNENYENALYIVDGKEVENLEHIEPSNVKNVKVLKGETAIDLYGEKGINGVVVIQTKSGKKSDSGYRARIDMKSQNQNQVDSNVDVMPKFPGGEAALKKYIDNSIDYPKRALEKGIIGTVYVEFIISKTGKVKDAKIARSVDPDLNKEALRVVSTLPLWKPGRNNGEPVDVTYTVPVEFNIKEFPYKIRSAAEGLSVPSPLYIVDGKEVEDITHLDPADIESIEVLKDKSAIDLYGEKGKNGVFEITSRNVFTDKVKVKSSEEFKDEKITSELELRKFIAKNIKYPVRAQEFGMTGSVSVLLEIDKAGKVKIGNQYPDIRLEEVVVVANNPPEKSSEMPPKNILEKEVKRVAKLLKQVDVDNFKGKTVLAIVKFRLQ